MCISALSRVQITDPWSDFSELSLRLSGLNRSVSKINVAFVTDIMLYITPSLLYRNPMSRQNEMMLFLHGSDRCCVVEHSFAVHGVTFS